jgi:hypothetical protein
MVIFKGATMGRSVEEAPEKKKRKVWYCVEEVETRGIFWPVAKKSGHMECIINEVT